VLPPSVCCRRPPFVAHAVSSSCTAMWLCQCRCVACPGATVGRTGPLLPWCCGWCVAGPGEGVCACVCVCVCGGGGGGGGGMAHVVLARPAAAPHARHALHAGESMEHVCPWLHAPGWGGGVFTRCRARACARVCEPHTRLVQRVQLALLWWRVAGTNEHAALGCAQSMIRVMVGFLNARC
jgi:hypothetical protein